MNKLRIYKTTNCPSCRMVMGRLDREGLPYSVTNVEEDEAAALRLKDAGMQMAPVFGWKGNLHTLADFPTIHRELAEQEKAA